MGDAGFVCALSGLPCPIGAPVVVFMLSQTPYEDHSSRSGFGLTSEWFLRTPPMQAKVEEFLHFSSDDDVMKQIWVWGLQADLLEKDWGENLVHDMEVRKGKGFDHYMEALRVGRLQVTGEHNRRRPLDPEREKREKEAGEENWNEHFPTAKRVRALLADKFPKAIVDDMTEGLVRVRDEDHYTGAHLLAMRELLSSFSTAITNVGMTKCILVMPTLEARHALGYEGWVSWEPKGVRGVLQLRLMVIREDVWRGVAQLGAKLPQTKPRRAMKKIVDELARDVATRLAPLDTTDMPPELAAKMKEIEERIADYGFTYELEQFFGSSIPFRMHIGEHIKELCRRGQIAPCATLLYQTHCVEQAMGSYGHTWRPSNGCLPYDGFHDHEVKVAQLFAKLSTKTRYHRWKKPTPKKKASKRKKGYR